MVLPVTSPAKFPRLIPPPDRYDYANNALIYANEPELTRDPDG